MNTPALDKVLQQATNFQFVGSVTIEAARKELRQMQTRLEETKNTINWLKGQYDYDESVLVGDIVHRLDANMRA